MLIVLGGGVEFSHACELKESSSGEAQVFRRHLIGPCTVSQRDGLSVSADLVFQALQSGKSVDLVGVTIRGDIMLDQLPEVPTEANSLLSSHVQEVVTDRGLATLRIVPGSLSIRDSVMKGTWATNLRDGLLIMLGDVVIMGTTFEQAMDFSHTMFVGEANFSKTIIRYEGFFVRTHFANVAVFSDTSFGTHSRFHKAIFTHGATFLQSQFNGLAEFLEVVFDKGTSFSQSRFRQGVGFSGTRFHGLLDFSHARFDREAFFRFVTFEQETDFREATFRGVSDFTSSTFPDTIDFAEVDFVVVPDFTGTSLQGEGQGTGKARDAFRVQIAIVLAVIGSGCILLWGYRKWKQSRIEV